MGEGNVVLATTSDENVPATGPRAGLGERPVHPRPRRPGVAA